MRQKLEKVYLVFLHSKEYGVSFLFFYKSLVLSCNKTKVWNSFLFLVSEIPPHVSFWAPSKVATILRSIQLYVRDTVIHQSLFALLTAAG